MERTPARTTPRPAALPEYDFRLYVSSVSPISARAVANIRRFLETHLKDRYRLAVLNIAEHVAAARADQIVASPTLVRIQPAPVRRFIGDMSDEQRLLAALNIRPPGVVR
jgi:circadian clock protein KaiB